MPVVRNGFVSNSSSSSFILMMRYRPYSLRAFRQLFNIDGRSTVYTSSSRAYRWGEISNRIYSDLASSIPTTWQNVSNEIQDNRSFPSMLRMSRFGMAIQPTMLREFNAVHNSMVELDNELKDIARRRIRTMFEMGYHFVTLTYGDENGDLSGAIEHGKHWNYANFPIVCISNH